MHFIVTAYDGTDEGACQRRLDAREQHLEKAKKMLVEKKFLYVAALLDDADKMMGSTLIVDFPSKADLEESWLKTEPYVTGDVWKKIEIARCKVPDFCLDLSWIDKIND